MEESLGHTRHARSEPQILLAPSTPFPLRTLSRIESIISMLTIAGGIILGGVVLMLFAAIIYLLTVLPIWQGLKEGLKGFRDGMKGVDPAKPPPP